MAFIQKIISANNVNNGSTVISAPRGGDFTSDNYDIVDVGYVSQTGTLAGLETRLNDIRYYTGDTPN